MRRTYGPYSVIYADPPWRFKNWSMAELAKRGEKWARRNGRSPYEVMNDSDVCGVPVGSLAARDCVLFMWATYPKLEEAMGVIRAWAFTFKTTAFTWVKLNPRGVGYHFGLGYWTRGNPEVCLLATRGHPKRVNNCVPNLIVSPRRDHSRKPDEARQRIVQLIGNVPRVELWAREATAGWDALGNELDGCDITEGIARLLAAAVPIPDLAAA